ncbi:GGDEF-domain containing protein [Cycloclasticus sp. 46_83_sub15_T18]|nr:GGDEF-domain containing protein [Cycloclasticus sp. 46_83_sub15_T18]
MFGVIKLRFLGIQKQFAWLMMLLAITIIIVYTAIVYVVKGEQSIEGAKNEIEILSHALENEYAELIILSLPSASLEVMHKWRSFSTILHAEIDDELGRSVLSFSRQGLVHSAIPQSSTVDLVSTDEQFSLMRPVIYAGKQVGSVRYVVSTNHQRLIAELQSTLLVSIPLALLLVGCLSLYLQRIVVSPLQRLISTVSTLETEQNYRTDMEVSTKDQSEFASLSRSFNALLSRVQQSLDTADEAQAYAQELANYDELTGLANRRLLIDHMRYTLELASREQRHGALLFIDLDNFKTLNDSRGHAAGDELLKQVAVSLKKVFRKEDTVARLGGDEFVILSGRLEDSEEAAANQVHSLMLKLRHVLAKSFLVQGEVYQLTASVGVTTFPSLANTPEELMMQADTAMYRAKEAGRDGYRFYQPEMQAAAEARLQMERELRRAISADEFELFYQPQVDEFGRILGAEALLRWFKPEGGGVSPAEFIPVAELTGLILPIGDWVLRHAFVQLKQWLEDGIDGSFRLSINISPLQFQQDSFVANVRALLNETGVPAKSITLEVTEGIAISDVQTTIDKMRVLTGIGFKVSMDDFGTGYSSLTYLTKLPLNELKIDQSFVRDLHVDQSDAELAATIIAMAQNLNLDVVAEGVETEAQLRFLCQHGCTIFQGYYFHKPMRSAALTELLQGSLVIIL